MPLVNDTFTDVEGALLEAHTSDSLHEWTQHPQTTRGLVVSSNRVLSTGGSNDGFYMSTFLPTEADYNAVCDVVVNNDTGSSDRASVLARFDASAESGYQARWRGGSTDEWQIRRADAGVYTTLSSFAQALTVDSTYEMTFELRGTSLKLYVDDVLRCETTDSTYTGAGKVGIGLAETSESIDNYQLLSVEESNVTAGKWLLYDKFKEYQGDGTIDLDSDTFKCALFLSTSNAAQLGVGTGLITDLTNQHANANGYTTGGATMTSVTWTENSGVVTFDADDASWTAASGSIVARFGVIYSTANDALVANCLLDNTPADVTAIDGQTLNIAMPASGIFTLSGGNT